MMSNNRDSLIALSGIETSSSALSKESGDKEGGSDRPFIDILIESKANVINMCEIKFTSEAFAVDKKYCQIILSRPERKREIVSPRMSIRSTLITTFGLVRNEYSGAFTNVVTMDDLFA